MNNVKLIPNTNVHHLHGHIVTSKGRPLIQQIVEIKVKSDKTYTFKVPLMWLRLLAKLRDGIPPHLAEYTDLLEFKMVLVPTYEDYYTAVPYLSEPIPNKPRKHSVCDIKEETTEELLHIIPGFLYNAIDANGVVYELYHHPKKKDWYWEQVYPNNQGNFELVNSLDGDTIELSPDDIQYLFLGSPDQNHQARCVEEKKQIEQSITEPELSIFKDRPSNKKRLSELASWGTEIESVLTRTTQPA